MNNSNHYHYDTINDTNTESASEEKRVISNHSGYSSLGSENFEHDESGNLMNYSGMEDEVFNSLAMHGDWQEGYDY